MIEILIGILGGLFIGSTGIGAGSLITPLLILSGTNPTIAVATGVVILAVAKSAGSVVHLRLGHQPEREGWIAIIAGVTGAMAVGLFVVQHERLIERAVGATVLLAVLAVIVTQRVSMRPSHTRNSILLALGSLVIGAVVALTSGGSGTLLVALLALTTQWETSRIAAVSNYYGAAIGITATLLNGWSGEVHWTLVLLVASGIVPGAALGALLSRHIPRQTFLRVFSVAGLAIGLKLLL